MIPPWSHLYLSCVNTNYEEYIDSRQLGGFHSFFGVLAVINNSKLCKTNAVRIDFPVDGRN